MAGDPARLRKFAQARLAAQQGSKPSGLSLAEIETKFVEKFTEKYKLTERDIQRAFKRFDADGSGFLDTAELTSAISLFLNGVERSRVAELVQRYDVDGDGRISLDEFTSFLISRASPNRDEWLTVDRIEQRGQRGADALPATGRDRQRREEADGEDDDEASEVADESHPPEYRAKVFLQNMKALLLRRATELKKDGKIALLDRLSQHANPLAESTARAIVAKAFAPHLTAGSSSTRVDLAAFTRVLAKFVYPGSPVPRGDVAALLFTKCGGRSAGAGAHRAGGAGGAVGADPDRLIDLVFDQGGSRVNKWGFVQPVQVMRLCCVYVGCVMQYI